MYIILGVQLCFRRFFLKFEALFLKSHYLFMIQSTVLYVVTGLATCGRALSCFRITLSCFSWYCGRFFQCSAQTHQLRSLPIPYDGFTRVEQVIIHHTVLVPPNAEHNLGTVNIWHFWSAYSDQHLPLQPSIEKRQKKSCTAKNN